MCPGLCRGEDRGPRERPVVGGFDTGDLVKMELARWSYPAERRVEEFLAERRRGEHRAAHPPRRPGWTASSLSGWFRLG